MLEDPFGAPPRLVDLLENSVVENGRLVGIITETDMLNLERESFMRLLGERKTLERIQHMLKKGKPLRN